MTANHPSSTLKQAEEILSRYERAKSLSQGMFKSTVPNSLLFPVWIKGQQQLLV